MHTMVANKFFLLIIHSWSFSSSGWFCCSLRFRNSSVLFFVGINEIRKPQRNSPRVNDTMNHSIGCKIDTSIKDVSPLNNLMWFSMNDPRDFPISLIKPIIEKVSIRWVEIQDDAVHHFKDAQRKLSVRGRDTHETRLERLTEGLNDLCEVWFL